jgi:hypothetical protein
MSKAHTKMPLKAHRRIWMVFLVMFTFFVLLTITNEVLDIPHYLFGDSPTSFAQRKGEIVFEIFIYIVVLLVAFYAFKKKIEKEIRILEGFIPICANCKKIRQEIDWKTLEEYISENSLAEFTHSICPDCIRLLYPEHAEKIIAAKKDSP